jgi:hypothetical protein
MPGMKRANRQLLEYPRARDSQYPFVSKTGPGARPWLKQSIVPVQSPFTVGAGQKVETTKTTESDIANRTFKAHVVASAV